MTNSTTTNHKEALIAETDIPATPERCMHLSFRLRRMALRMRCHMYPYRKECKTDGRQMEHGIGNDHLALSYTHDGVER